MINPNLSTSLNTTWNTTLINPSQLALEISLSCPEAITLGSVLSSFLSSLGLELYPKNLEKKLLLSVALKIWIFLLCLPVDVGTWTHPYPLTISFPFESTVKQLRTNWGQPNGSVLL